VAFVCGGLAVHFRQSLGDLQTAIKVTGSQDNNHGQLLQSSDANGVVTSNTYDLRQRLLSTMVDGKTSSCSYDPVGQLKKVTQPDYQLGGLRLRRRTSAR